MPRSSNIQRAALERISSLAEMREHAADAAQMLKALANESRLLVLCTLIEGELSVGELNQKVDISQSALSQHLALLRRDGLVTTRRESQTIFYSLAEGPVEKIIDVLHEIYCAD